MVAEQPANRELQWIPPQSGKGFQFSATLVLPQSGSYVARAGFSSYAGEDAIGGQLRIRGSVFSDEVEIDVN
jgi:hypothetical protein